MARIYRIVAALVFLALSGCAPPQPGAHYGPLPPQPPGTARLVFYRAVTYYGPQEWMTVYLNSKPTAVSRPGAFFYRDVPPGRYDLTMQTYGYYPNQFKTVVMRAGEEFYVNIDTLPRTACGGRVAFDCGFDIFILTVVDPAQGYRDIQGLHLIAR